MYADKRGIDMAMPQHERLCSEIVDNAPEAVIYADREGIIRLWNAGAVAMFGYSAEEALGKSLDIIIPENLRARHWEGYNRTMATGESKYGKDLLAVPGIRKDGTRISLEFSILLLRDEGGKLMGPAAIFRDVTARWKKDKEIKDRLAALETDAKKRG
jgi:PAS domain S-box-containing protein